MKKRSLTTTCLLAALPMLVACGIIPKDGPTGEEVRAGAEVQLSDPSSISYALVKLTPTVIRHTQRVVTRPVLFRSNIRAIGLPNVRVGPGDTVTVTIFEAQAGGLFVPAQPGTTTGNFVTLPAQQVDRSGQITVPYAGAVNAVGRTPAEIQADIEDKLRSRAIEPQVVVAINNRQSDEVSVLGEVNAPTRFPLEPGGTRILNAIARAGGTRNPGYESVVTLQRRGRTDQALLTSIVSNPSYNVNLAPGDVVYVSREPRYFLVFGATPAPGGSLGTQSRRVAFNAENLTLADGVAVSGGLDNLRADPRSVFLFRLESKRLLAEMGVDVSKYKEPLVPTVYMADLSDTQGIFLANSFYMKHQDVVFAADSPTVDLIKLLDVIRAISNTVTDVSVARNAVRNF